MKKRLCRLVFSASCLLGLISGGFAQESGSGVIVALPNPPPLDFPSYPVPIGPRKISTTVTLRRLQLSYVQASQPPTVLNLMPGTELRATIDFTEDPGLTYFYAWDKDGVTLLNQTDRTLVIPALGASDSGIYHAHVYLGSGGQIFGFEDITLRVEEPNRQRLLNLSTRATLGPQQPFFITGFVVSSDPAATAQPKSVLIRVIGPTLAGYGVSDPLAKPAVRILRADGTEVTPTLDTDSSPATRIKVDTLAARLGAFPLPDNSADVVRYMILPAGIYSAHVSSADGGSGTVLLELYEVSSEDAWSLGLGLAN